MPRRGGHDDPEQLAVQAAERPVGFWGKKAIPQYLLSARGRGATSGGAGNAKRFGKKKKARQTLWLWKPKKRL